MLTNRTRIQEAVTAAVYAAAVAGKFPAVVYGVDTKLPEVDEAVTSTPGTVLVNELSSSFDPPERYRRGDARERSDWRFELILEFNREVVLEQFEEILMETPVRVLRDEAAGLPQATLYLAEAEYEHPAMQSGAKGSRVTYRLNAMTSPR